ncbi:hypothetical protein AB0M22_17000 [Nocardia sp. NPDC051756]|uniref:hypothetical protein n=1 Tax=Nocardia sp. NPDC051756 TaxID=3154751 RepID=UPI00342581B6
MHVAHHPIAGLVLTGAVEGFTDEQTALLIDGLNDDVSFDWVLVHLGLITNPPAPGRPTTADIDAAFVILRRLHRQGLIAVGRIEYVDGGPSGRLAPVKHVPEDLNTCRERVQREVAASSSPPDWAYSCWVVNTAAGNAIARSVLAERPK